MPDITPEQRATMIVQEYHAKRCWGYDPVQHTEYERLIADAIRQAVAQERSESQAILTIVDRAIHGGCVWKNGSFMVEAENALEKEVARRGRVE